MADAAISCPSRQVLSAFSLGKLSNADMALVAGHLETCAECSRLLEQLPPDSFVGKVRGAKPTSGTQLPSASRLDGLALKSDGPPPADLPPELAKHPKYRIVRELGRGGMGVVYEAIHTGMDRRIAIKVINPSLLEHPDALPRFQSEVKAAGRLEHENIVRAYDTDTAGNLHLLVMEFVQGKNLADWVRQQGPLTTVSACLCIRQAALGLQYAYEQGMVHRDIKPHNLMATAQGKLKILDFGLARVRGKGNKGRLTQMDAFMGTPEYVSPEQATDARNADIRSDIYSLGCTLYFLLTGRPPFQAETLVKLVLAQIEQEPQPVHEVRAEVPEALSAVVGRMLMKDPTQRYQTPVEVAQAMMPFLKAGAKSKPVAAPLPPGVSSPEKATVMGADTSQMPKVGRVSTPPPVRRAQTEAKPFEGLDSGEAPRPPQRKPRRLKTNTVWRRRPTIAWVALGLLALILVKLWAGFEFQVKTTDGTIVLENLPPKAEVTVDGKIMTVKPGNGNTYEVSVPAGQKHSVQVKVGGVTVVGKEVRIEAGERHPIRITLQPGIAHGNQPVPQRELGNTPPQSVPEQQLPPNSSAKVADYDAIARGKWIPVLRKQTDLQESNGIGFEGAVLASSTQGGRVAILEHRSGDAIIRARVKKVTGQNLAIGLRRSLKNGFGAWFNGGDMFGIGKHSEGQWIDLGGWNSPSNFDDYFEFAFSAVGDLLTIYADGKRIGQVRDADHREGFFSISAKDGRSLFRDVEIMILDDEIKSQQPTKANVGPVAEPPTGGQSLVPLDERWKRQQQHWNFRIHAPRSEDYLRVLAGLGAILVIPQSDGKYAVIRDLTRIPAKPKVEDISSIKGYCFVDRRPEEARKLLAVLGVDQAPPYFAVFFPRALEDELRRLERTYRNKPESEITGTTFAIEYVGGKFVPRVFSQK